MIVYVTSITEFPKNLLSHILTYYTARGVDKFIFGVYSGNPNTWKELEEAAKTYPIEIHEASGVWSTGEDSNFKNQIRMKLSPADWIIPADTDEFHTHPDYDTFPLLADAMEEEKADYTITWLIDRITEDGTIPSELLPIIPLTEQFPRTKLISKEIMKCYTGKTIMLRPRLEIYPGHHFLPPYKRYKAFSKNALTHHFKWYGNIREKEEVKIALYKSFDLPWYQEQLRLFEHLDKNEGRL